MLFKLSDISSIIQRFCCTGAVVSSGQFGLTKMGDQVSVNISQLQAPHDAIVANYLNDMNITVTDGIAIIDGCGLCFSITTDVRDSLSTVLPIETVCGQCGKQNS